MDKDNPDKLDFVKSDSRVDLLENKVVLVTPEGNPKGIKNFNDMAAKLRDGSIRLVMGNSDVPVGQYTQKILKFHTLDEQAIAEPVTSLTVPTSRKSRLRSVKAAPCRHHLCNGRFQC